MEITHGFGLRAFGCNIRVTTDSHELKALLESYVFPSLPRSEIGPDRPDLSIRVFRSSERFHLSIGNVVVASTDRAIDLVTRLTNVIDETVVSRVQGLHAVHAGAVLLGDRALLLPGSSHSGKSSLVAELLRRGAKYFSDEYALIDSEGRAHPYPRPLLLRNGSPDQSPVLPEECNSSAADQPRPVGWILLLEYMPVGSWSIAPIPQSLALLALLKNTPHFLTESPGMVGSFQRAVEGAICYAGRRTEAVDAATEILGLVGCLS